MPTSTSKSTVITFKSNDQICRKAVISNTSATEQGMPIKYLEFNLGMIKKI
jgi:hypothetical protein